MGRLVDDSSILMSIKRLLNIDPEEMAFDSQIGMLINEEFMTLHQLGIGPDDGFYIFDADTRWTDFSEDKTLINTVKTYIYYRVRLSFDPPGSSIVSDAINSRIAELQFRLNVQAEKAWESEGTKPDILPPPPPPHHHDDDDDEDEDEDYYVDNENLVMLNTSIIKSGRDGG